MFRFTIRDVLWLMVVVALGMGWWIDQDRIRRERVALKAEAERLQALPLRHADAKLKVMEAELASMIEIRQLNPAAVSESEFRRAELQLEVAKLDVEKARAREELGPATNPSPNGQNSN